MPREAGNTPVNGQGGVALGAFQRIAFPDREANVGVIRPWTQKGQNGVLMVGENDISLRW
jgi:hypothetical protein